MVKKEAQQVVEKKEAHGVSHQDAGLPASEQDEDDDDTVPGTPKGQSASEDEDGTIPRMPDEVQARAAADGHACSDQWRQRKSAEPIRTTSVARRRLTHKARPEDMQEGQLVSA